MIRHSHPDKMAKKELPDHESLEVELEEPTCIPPSVIHPDGLLPPT